MARSAEELAVQAQQLNEVIKFFKFDNKLNTFQSKNTPSKMEVTTESKNDNLHRDTEGFELEFEENV
ncbi:MAG: hypothetical protein AAGI07_13780 [Bacteroidota bacterium]